MLMHNYRDGAAMQGGLPALTSLHYSEKRHANIPIFSPNSPFGPIQLTLSPPQPLENVETPGPGTCPAILKCFRPATVVDIMVLTSDEIPPPRAVAFTGPRR